MTDFKRIRLFVLDMDGTIYLDETPLPGALQLCRHLSQEGRLLYFTNNASRSPMDYINKLTRLGFPSGRELLLSSADVTIDSLHAHHAGQPVYLVGTPALERAFSDAGIALSDQAKIVVVSFDTTLTYEKLARACALIRNGALFYSTHPDLNCPVADGFVPDSGAICAAITASTGVKPRFFGKPYPETAQTILRRTGLRPEQVAVIGDRLYTDIALGRKNGIFTILVLSGETTKQMVSQASPGEQPDLIVEGAKDLLPLLGIGSPTQ